MLHGSLLHSQIGSQGESHPGNSTVMKDTPAIDEEGENGIEAEIWSETESTRAVALRQSGRLCNLLSCKNTALSDVLMRRVSRAH